MSTNHAPMPANLATGAVLETISHKEVDLLNPTEDMIDIGDIAKGLSLLCRFSGQISRFYSLAQHAILVQALCPPEIRLEALLFDASAAYLGESENPLKHAMGAHYKGIEFRFQNLISQKFGLDKDKLQKVREVDLHATGLENQALRENDLSPLLVALGSSGMIVAGTEAFWRPLVAELEFKRIYTELFYHR